MKVLFTTNIPSPYRVDFFNELSKYCELTVIFEKMGELGRREEWIKKDNWKFKTKSLKKIKIMKDKVFCPEIIDIIKNNKFDLIVIGGYSTLTSMYAINYLKRKKIPYILNADGGFIEKKENRLKKEIKKYFIKSAQAWLSTGKETNRYLKYYSADIDRIYTYKFTSLKEYEIEKNKISESEKKIIKKELGIKENLIIISVGQFIYRKGYDILIKAISKLKNSDIGTYIIGGKESQEYIELKNKYKLNNLHFIDFQPKERLKMYYKVADIFVLPTREDIWGLVINEAMANGLPIITTNKCIAGIEIIENGVNGYIVPTENENELSYKIKNILEDEELRKKISRNNLEKSKQYTIENMAKEHIEIFKKILEKRKNGD